MDVDLLENLLLCLSRAFYAPSFKDLGHIAFALSVCLSVCLWHKIITLSIALKPFDLELLYFHTCLSCDICFTL